MSNGGYELKVPDGMQVTQAMGKDGPVLVFYTGRFATEYDVDEVLELRDALNAWLEDKGVPQETKAAKR